MKNSLSKTNALKSLLEDDLERERAFTKIMKLGGLKNYIRDIICLIIENRITKEDLEETLSSYQIKDIAEIKEELMDVVLLYTCLILERGAITDKEIRSIGYIKLFFNIQEGDFYKHKNDDVKEVLEEQFEKMYSDNKITPEEALHTVFLQGIFDYSYDQLDKLKEYEVCRALAESANIIDLDTANINLYKNGKLNKNYIANILNNKQQGTHQDENSRKEIQVNKLQIELNELTGLQSVKEEITTFVNFLNIQQQRQEKGLKSSQLSYHCVFTGNPGTGKTTVARIVADIYKNLGILTKGHLVETDRSGLVAEYVGQTAAKTNQIIDSALDGVLFIDEAYSLISKSENDYGKEAIATLLKRMEDNRDRLVVILAGYSAEMRAFIDSNPGLQSRFNRYIEFPDYSAEELYQIFEKNAKKSDYTISKDAEIPLKKYLAHKVANKDQNFGNARFVRNLFEKTIERQANRLSKEVGLTGENLSAICSIDIPM
jgi:SpoVK/Ycf46/Vps4 family AAA+-type ATPase